MPKIVIETGMVLNLGGFVVERKANLPCIDVVVGNPLGEDVKAPAPVYSREMLDEYVRLGLLVDYLQKGDSLKEKLGEMRARVDERLGRS